MILIDTDVWIDFFSGRDPGARAVETLLRRSNAAVSVISVFELYCGATRKRQLQQLETLVTAVEPFPWTRQAARKAAELYLRLKSRGGLISNQDLMLAGTADELGTAILTRNRAHFERIAGLQVLSPEQVVSG